MEAAVFDEDFVGPLAGDDYASEIDAGDVAFERRGIADWAAVVGFVQLHAQAFDEVEVRMIASQGEDEMIRQE